MVAEADILDVLRTIPDPEMPISIVDLGIVHRIGVETQAGPDARAPQQSAVVIEILPTFVGCPALRVIEEQVIDKVAQLVGVESVRVDIVYDPPWSVDRISPAGRAALAEVGVTVPRAPDSLVKLGLASADRPSPACPFCGAHQTQLESSFGPTRCKMIYYCPACGNSCEHLKDLR